MGELQNLKTSLGKGHSVLISPNSNSVEELAHANSFHQYSSFYIIHQPERAVPIAEREEKNSKCTWTPCILWQDLMHIFFRLNKLSRIYNLWKKWVERKI